VIPSERFNQFASDVIIARAIEWKVVTASVYTVCGRNAPNAVFLPSDTAIDETLR